MGDEGREERKDGRGRVKVVKPYPQPPQLPLPACNLGYLVEAGAVATAAARRARTKSTNED